VEGRALVRVSLLVVTGTERSEIFSALGSNIGIELKEK
jgi:hypothetical protein